MRGRMFKDQPSPFVPVVEPESDRPLSTVLDEDRAASDNLRFTPQLALPSMPRRRRPT
jgi:hypothetical protein